MAKFDGKDQLLALVGGKQTARRPDSVVGKPIALFA